LGSFKSGGGEGDAFTYLHNNYSLTITGLTFGKTQNKRDGTKNEIRKQTKKTPTIQNEKRYRMDMQCLQLYFNRSLVGQV